MPTDPRLNSKPRTQIGSQGARPAHAKQDGASYISPLELAGYDAVAAVWRTSPTSPSGGIPAGQIAYGGTVSGLTSDPHWLRDPVTGSVSLLDENGALLVRMDGLADDRKFWIFDETGVAVTLVSGKAATRLVDVFDAAGLAISEIDTKTAARTFSLFAPDGATPIFVGDTRQRILQFASGTQVTAPDKAVNFTADPTVSRDTLSADGLTITLNDATLPVGWTCEYVSMTGTLAPANIFAPTAGTIVSAGIPAAATSTWPPGATIVTVTKKAAGVYARS